MVGQFAGCQLGSDLAPHLDRLIHVVVAEVPLPAGGVDVAAILNDLAANNKQKLNWKTSIVDLMKLLDLDSGLSDRKELAQELNYSGDMNDSASMNIWLHRQVMNKLAENGGKVPDDLKD